MAFGGASITIVSVVGKFGAGGSENEKTPRRQASGFAVHSTIGSVSERP
jgi:hypothetical protein